VLKALLLKMMFNINNAQHGAGKVSLTNSNAGHEIWEFQTGNPHFEVSQMFSSETSLFLQAQEGERDARIH
jgi:hypothetical protein